MLQIYILFGVSILIGIVLLKSIKISETINTAKKLNIAKSIVIGVFFSPSIAVVPAGSSAGIYMIPATVKFFISGSYQSALLVGVLPILLVSIVAYLFLNKGAAA